MGGNDEQVALIPYAYLPAAMHALELLAHQAPSIELPYAIIRGSSVNVCAYSQGQRVDFLEACAVAVWQWCDVCGGVSLVVFVLVSTGGTHAWARQQKPLCQAAGRVGGRPVRTIWLAVLTSGDKDLQCACGYRRGTGAILLLMVPRLFSLRYLDSALTRQRPSLMPCKSRRMWSARCLSSA